MKKLTTLLLAMVACAGTMFASDTSVDGIWYNFDDGKLTAEVTYQGADSYSYSNEYSGEVVIPSSVTYNAQTYTVTSIGDEAFRYCSGLTSVTIPNSVTSIGSYAFYDCTGLTSVTIGNSVTSIGDYAFSWCTGLTSVTIPNSVTSIGSFAFSGCSGLTSVTIPNSVTSIGDYAFDGCSSLTSLSVEAGNTVYDSRNNCNAIIETSTNTLISGCQNTTIPNSVISIGVWAFGYCSGLTSVEIPNSVTSIGGKAFYNCTGLTSVTNYATTPQSINSEVFTGVDKSTCVLNVPKKSVSLYQAAEVWKEFTNIVGVDVPASDTSVGGIWYNFDDEHLTAEVTYQGDAYDTYSNEYSGEVVIPASVTYNAQTYTVTSIGDWAFSRCRSLTSVTIPNSVTSIGDNAFRDCTSLTSVTIGNSVTSIGNYAFFGCSSLTSIDIPNSVKGIGGGAFQNCTGLTSVTIPNSVTSIGDCAFSRCSSLTSVTIPNSVTSIGFDAFSYCTSLTSVTIGNSVTNIGYYAFSDCTGLTSVTIPNSVTSIGEGAFYSCRGLTSVTIGNSITSIGYYAFYGCSITTLTVLATTPPSGGSACEINAGNCTLYVPTESVNTYANTIWWEDFKEIKPLGDLICVQFVDWDGSLIVRCYIEEGASAIAPANLTREGYTFIGWDKEFSNVTEDLVVTALYKEAGHNMTYTLLFQNGIDDSEITHEAITFMLPVAPSITGFTFLKWVVVGGDLVDTITIQAVYQANTPTSAPAVYTNPANPAQKLIKNGNVYILTDDKTYTITGQKVK